jgi:hypothetical protein
MMNAMFLDANAPLYGRALKILRVGPIAFRHFCRYARVPPGARSFQLFSLVGGVPKYWEWLEVAARGRRKDPIEIAERMFFSPLGWMEDEPRRVLADERLAGLAATSVLEAIGRGAHRPSEIAGRLGGAHCGAVFEDWVRGVHAGARRYWDGAVELDMVREEQRRGGGSRLVVSEVKWRASQRSRNGCWRSSPRASNGRRWRERIATCGSRSSTRACCRGSPSASREAPARDREGAGTPARFPGRDERHGVLAGLAVPVVFPARPRPARGGLGQVARWSGRSGALPGAPDRG